MSYRIRLVALLAGVAVFTGGDLLACGDKFLVASRGTRYQRPKNARAASVVIYANPTSGFPAAIGKVPVESVLRREGHRSTSVETLEQLSALLAGGRFDIVLAASSVVETIAGVLGATTDAPVLVAFCEKGQERPQAGKSTPCVKAPPKEGALLQAIDKAVAERDQNIRKAQISG